MKKKTKRILAGIGGLALAAALYLATPYTPHPVGFHAAYRLGFDGTLHISGTGELAPWRWSSVFREFRRCSIDRLWPLKYFAKQIKAVEMSDGFTAIGDLAFIGCDNLTNMIIPDRVTSIGEWAFKSSSLTNVTIPDSVTTIGDYAFNDCTSLTNVTIPDSVISIGRFAFAHSGLTSVTIPDSVTSIGLGPFADCANLTGIWVAEENQNFCNDEKGVLYDKTMTTLLQCLAGLEGTFEVPDSVTSIGICAFSGCNRLTKVTIPDSVTSIGVSAFFGCSSLTNVTIPASVAYIGESAFWYCTSLREITFEGDAPVLYDDCFLDVEATVHYPADNPTWAGIVQQTYGGDITWVAY